MKHYETIAASLVGQSAAGHAILGEGAWSDLRDKGWNKHVPYIGFIKNRMNQKKCEHLHHNQRYY
jgi:hypothetical protein